MTNIYHATPYDISAAGFYFNTYDEYQNQSASHRNEHGALVEEYEIQFIDGENSRLFSALSVCQANLKDWFEHFETLEGEDAIKAFYLAEEQCYLIDDILDRLDDVYLFEGSALEYAENYLEDTGLLDQIPENLRFYFDTESFARDLLLGGDITELEINGTAYIVQSQ
ncbi:MAG: antirestriction protein ArdA [Parvibaculaceae bacterium]|nr:antirestriction protein ArdA [Parvibaculaceae bacterium]|tara:strand:- start:2076 stop:2579 length:504 start_codon:yes stop_codon:yes gene_type:complete